MSRINLHDDDGKLCWFDDAATQDTITEGSYWDGNNWRGAVSGLQTSRACLLLTRGGRWVENVNSTNEFNGSDVYRFLADDQVREWLVKAGAAQRGGEGAEAALAKYFPDTPDEAGPAVGGRPKIGPTINVAYPVELITRIDAAAAKDDVSRAEWLRRLADAHA